MTTRRLQIGLAIILLGAVEAVAHGQGITIKGGLSYGTASNTGLAPGATQRSGFAVGIGAANSGVVGLGIEGLYAQRGFTSSAAGLSRKLDYLDVPVYVRVAMPFPLVSPFAYAGPQASYEMNCDTGSGNCPDSGRPKFTYSAVIGAGLKFGALGGLSLEGRYVYGLENLNLNTVSASSSYKTRSLLILLGFGL